MGVRNENSTEYVHPDEPNLLNLHKAMQYNSNGEPELRTISAITGNIIIEGEVNIPGNIQVFSTPEDPVHTHITEIGTSGTLDVPYIPIDGNVKVTSGNIRITGGNVNANISGNVVVSSGNVTVDGNVGVLGNVTVLQGTIPWSIVGNIQGNITGGNINANVSGNVVVSSGNVNANVSGNVVITSGNVNSNVSGNVVITSGNINSNVSGNVVITSGNINSNVSGNVVVSSGNINANVSGNVQANITNANIQVTQGTIPWSVTGNVNSNVTGGNISITGNIAGITSLPSIQANVTGGNISVLGNVDIGTMPPITGNVEANITGGNINANVTQGTIPWSVSGNVNATLNSNANVNISGFGGATSDAFGRLRVSEPFTLFDTNSRYYDHGQFSNVNVGTANVVYVANQSSFQLNVGTANNDSVIRESKKVFPYQPGKSQLTLSTFCMNTPKTNLRQRVGLFGANDGVFFENDGTYNYMVIRSGSTGVEERVRQDAWNGDRLNGLGGANNPSGITLFPNRAQIFYADVEWLGVGSVRVGFVIDGVIITCHTFNHANQPGNTKVYMTTATLPIRYEITNTGATANASMMTQICSTVISEGGYNSFGTTQSAGTGTTQKRLTNSNTYYPIVSIRLNSSRLDSIVFPRQIDVLSPSVNYYRWVLLLNPTLTGATFATTSPTGTVDIDTAATAISGGIEIQSGYASARELSILSAVDYFQFQLGRTLAGVSDIVTLAIAATANNADVLAELGWQELT